MTPKTLLLPTLLLSLLLVLPSPYSQVEASPTSVQNVNFSPASLPKSHDFRRAHSYPSDYFLSPRDGWQSITATDLPYKYANSTHPERRLSNEVVRQMTSSTVEEVHPEGQAIMRRGKSSKKSASKKKGKGGKGKKKFKTGGEDGNNNNDGQAVDSATSVLDDSTGGLLGGLAGDVMKAIGKVQEVIITWYTGYDLQNPSCWANGDWAPTDQSFACALTMEGWEDRPACFKFLELCNGPTKCVFVRIVDTCAGCAVGSKHVDLTQAAFSSLADLDQGKLWDIKMRMATDPSEEVWDESMWGPRVV